MSVRKLASPSIHMTRATGRCRRGDSGVMSEIVGEYRNSFADVTHSLGDTRPLSARVTSSRADEDRSHVISTHASDGARRAAGVTSPRSASISC